MNHEEKYTRIEYERRFIIPPHSNWRGMVEAYSKILDDKYLRDGHLRLRVMTDSDTGRQIIKLTKKVESETPFVTRISRILLSQAEYGLFDAIEGFRLKKTRFYHNYLGQVFSIDVFEGSLSGLVLCETEADNLDELLSVQLPPYAQHEVTKVPFFAGGNLCRVSRSDLEIKLSTFQ
jgi:CYTH domain-containing protein